MGQDPGVNLFGLILRLSNQPGLPWVRQDDIDAKLLQYVVNLNPQVACGLDDGSDLVPEGGELQGELLYALHIVPEPDGVPQGPSSSMMAAWHIFLWMSIPTYFMGVISLGGLRAACSYGVSMGPVG